MNNMKPSAVREILKASADISFSAGNPSAETFPAGELAALARDIFQNDYAEALQYGISEGYGPLRELTQARMRDKYGIGSDQDDIIITSGGQQGIDLAIKCLTNEGDAVICENPSFIGALNDFRSNATRLIGIPVTGEGMDLDRLEQALKTEKNIKMIYTIPTFQNPTGVTMPLERRKRLYELAVRHDVMIVEDDPYSELRYSGERVPAIKTLDETDHVLYVGSYSKVIAPGIRVGYAIGPRELLAKMTVAKQCQDVHTNLFFMILVARYVEQCAFDEHIAECCRLYRVKRDRMLAVLDEKLDSRMTYTRPDGGLFIWGELPEGYSGTELCTYTAARSVAMVPGTAFDVTESPLSRGFRLNFSVPSLEQIDKGITLLSESIDDYLK